MKHLKQVLAVAGLIVTGSAFAMPGFSEQAPSGSIDVCVAQISDKANYEHAGRVRHEVDSKARRVGGHTIRIETTVYDEDSGELIREYATVCAVNDNQETKKFRMKEKGV